MPSRHYPSAAPYAALTQYLRELIHERTLTRFIVKALLYPEFLRDIDTTEVKLRRRHKTFVRMYRRGSSESSTEEEGSETDTERLERQDAVEYTSSDRSPSRIYSGVNYRTGKTDSWEGSGTVYESFIDHGEGAGEVCYQRLHDSVSSFCFVTECESPTRESCRESFMIGSTPTKYVEIQHRDSGDNVIHLTTAKMNLLEIKQKSEQSQTSSFEHRLSGGGWKHMACEDLLNIDDSFQNKNGNKHKPFEEKHHSMPVQFVGNRFNESSLTEIYIPSCRSQNENVKHLLETPCNSFEDNEPQKSSHSSSLMVQERKEMTIPAPDKLTAEILYNLKQLNEASSSHCLTNLSKIREHSIDSDKRMSIDKGNSSIQPFPERPDEHEPVYANKRFDSKFMPPATIYSSDSDSGMAGSYTLSPSDQFGYHRSFISHKFNPHVTPSSIDYFATHPISDPRKTLNQEGLNDLNENHDNMSRCLPQDDSFEGENRTRVVINFESGIKNTPPSSGDNVYYSGMYAHWWKKEKLPLEMLESIAKSSDGESDKRDRGSGKKPLKIHFNDVALSCFFYAIIFYLVDND